MPVRIQRKRTKGWKMPENTVSVTRPGDYGNPFKVGDYVKIGTGANGFAYMKCWDEKYVTKGYTKVETIEQAVDLFREYRSRYPLHKKEIEYLRGKNLACWCALDKVCHADVLLELANKLENINHGTRF